MQAKRSLFLRAIINSCEVIKFVNDVLSNAFKYLQLIACLCTSLIKEKKQVFSAVINIILATGNPKSKIASYAVTSFNVLPRR